MEKKIIAYIALEEFKSEDARVIVAKGDMVSVEDWNTLSPAYDQGKFKPLRLSSVIQEASREAENLANHLDGVAKFNDPLSWKGVEKSFKALKVLMHMVEAAEAQVKTKTTV